MPSTCIALSPSILATLRGGADELSFHLSEDAMYANPLDNGNIEIGFDAVIVAPEAAPPFDCHARGLFLCRDGFPEACLTRFDDDGLRYLLERARDLIARHSGLTGHDRLQMIASFADAIGAVPSAAATRQDATRGNTAGVKLASTLGSELAALDAELAEYFKSISGSFLEGPIAALGFQSELADGLLIGNARTTAGARKAVLIQDPGRKPGRYQSALEISDMLELHGQRVSPFRFGIGGVVDWKLVEMLHFIVFQKVFDRAGKVRERPILIRRQGREDWLAEGLAQERIAAAMARWTKDFQLDRWQRVHWLIRITLAHIAFERIHPFSDGNGRIGRLIMHLQMSEAGKPLLPLEAAIRRSRQDYLVAIDEAIGGGNAEPFLRYLIDACMGAICIGQRLQEELRPMQHRLTAALRATRLVTRRHPFLVAQLLAHLVLEHRDLEYVFELPGFAVAELLEQRCGIERLDIDGKPAWIIPGIQQAVQRACA